MRATRWRIDGADMDQGTAILLAAVVSGVVGVGGTLVGGWVEAGRANRRSAAERAWQKEQADLAWQRQEQQAQRARVREATIRDLHITRDYCLANLTAAHDKALGVDTTELVRDLVRPKYGDADTGLLGDHDSALCYFEALARLGKHTPGSGALTEDEARAYASAKSAVRLRTREQEMRANRDEPTAYITALDLGKLPEDILDSPTLQLALAGPPHPAAWSRTPESGSNPGSNRHG